MFQGKETFLRLTDAETQQRSSKRPSLGVQMFYLACP